MVGEIRDRETAENAIQAALTGHLVLSTLHTNDAPSSITRLFDLGIKPFLIANTLVGVVAQRLVRKICPYDQEDVWLSAEDLRAIGISVEGDQRVKLKSGKGCIHCRETGYLGRIGVFEVMCVSESLRNLIHKEVDEGSLRVQAQKEGMTILRDDAAHKMLEGITTYEEVIRVVGLSK
jgi:general secretion pathway protein E